jgi:hypothetical protein
MLTQINNISASELHSFKQRILDALSSTPEVTDEDIENALENNYIQAHQMITEISEGSDAEEEKALFRGRGNGRKIWRKIKEFICSHIDEQSEQEVILDIILAALAMVMPLGAIALKIATWILKKFIERGVGQMCGI